jgi:1-acyl-sn-glycerol-3-phosphate acyltransferase
MPAVDRSRLPGPSISPIRRTIRYWLSRLVVAALARAYVRPRIEGRDRLPPGPAIYCFNHLSWVDPFVLMAVLPFRPRLWFFGPKEEDMAVGGRNRLMSWTGSAIPYKPGKNDLLDATRHVAAVIGSGGVVAIAGEGRIHARESDLLPLSEGAAYFALRSGVPLVPIAINGTSWLRFGGRVRVRVGEPIAIAGRPTRESVDAVTTEAWTALHALVAEAPDLPEPGPVGRWLSERFNEWPEGSREAALAAAESRGLAYFEPSE